MIPAYNQKLDRDEIFVLIKDFVGEYGITVHGLETDYTPEGIDLGINSFVLLEKPEIMMFVGDGISSRDAGEIWHIFDRRFKMPVTMIDGGEVRSFNMSEYNVVVMAGNPSLSETQIQELIDWNRKGGVIIAY